MYRVGQGALDQQIAQAVAAVGEGEHLATVDAHLRDEGFRLQAQISLLSENQSNENRLSLDRLWSLLWRIDEMETAIHQADQVILMVALKAELEFVRARRLEVAKECSVVAGASERLTELLTQKEAWLVRTQAPGNAVMLEIARVRGNWQALIECLRSAHNVASDAQSEVLQATAYFEDAHNPDSRQRASGFSSGSKEGQLQQASVHAGMANIHTRTLEIELSAIQRSGEPLPVKIDPVLMPSQESSEMYSAPNDSLQRLLGDGEVNEAQNDRQVLSGTRLGRESTRISAVISAIEPLLRHSRQKLETLESKRRQLLGDRG